MNQFGNSRQLTFSPSEFLCQINFEVNQINYRKPTDGCCKSHSKSNNWGVTSRGVKGAILEPCQLVDFTWAPPKTQPSQKVEVPDGVKSKLVNLNSLKCRRKTLKCPKVIRSNNFKLDMCQVYSLSTC